ncbi:MAG TPA: DUF1273 domain-containing protein [Candidatus Alistipes stercoripullorum]|uniref:SLOG family protein n=1 Tax=Alistipes dispar TaxID=2585119 RepID=UPI001F90082A|nr:SLOG family protein [uncultured Alistipes sp.]HJC20043.1 DUF1273 domain-containing protein [Candidatus Alistipes stercoripullorum]
MIADSGRSVAFTGHRTYDGTAAESLSAAVERLYGRGFRTFLSGMAVGFDLAAAEAVLTLRAAHPDVRLVAVVPFRGQEERFSPADRVRFRRAVAAADEVEVLAGGYRRGCYAVRNDFLVDRAALVVAWYDGSPGGTRYTLRRALARGREVWNLHPSGGGLAIRPVQPALF